MTVVRRRTREPAGVGLATTAPDSVDARRRKALGCARRARAAADAGAGKFVEAGQHLIEMKEHAAHGEWTELVTERVGISPRLARTLMQVAAHPALSKRHHDAVLPTDYNTLAILAQLEESAVQQAIESGEVNRDMSRGDARKVAGSASGKHLPETLPETLLETPPPVIQGAVESPDDTPDDAAHPKAGLSRHGKAGRHYTEADQEVPPPGPPSATYDAELAAAIRAAILVIRSAGQEERGDALRRLARQYGGPTVGAVFDTAWPPGDPDDAPAEASTAATEPALGPAYDDAVLAFERTIRWGGIEERGPAFERFKAMFGSGRRAASLFSRAWPTGYLDDGPPEVCGECGRALDTENSVA